MEIHLKRFPATLNTQYNSSKVKNSIRDEIIKEKKLSGNGLGKST